MSDKLKGPAALQVAQAHLAAGRTEQAKQVALGVYWQPRADSSSTVEGQAALIAARADLLASSLHEAGTLAVSALKAFERAGDLLGFSEALMLLSYSQASAGRPEAGFRFADEAVALLTRGESFTQNTAVEVRRRQLAAATNYRGVAAFWGGEYACANETLRLSTNTALQEGGAAQTFHPLVNRCFNEVLRVENESSSAEADTAELQRLTYALQHLHSQSTQGLFNNVAPVLGSVLQRFVLSYTHALQGDQQGLQRQLVECHALLAKVGASSWTRSLPMWVKSVWAERNNAPVEALNWASKMELAATAGEHKALAATALARQRRLARKV